MAELKLSFDEILNEFRGMAELAGPFLEGATIHLLAGAERDLLNIRRRGGGTWQIPVNHPLITKATRSYQPDGKGGIEVVGTLSFIWEIKVLSHREFALFGKTSTVLTILGEDAEPIVCWKTEMGDAGSPGCHFHVQLPRIIDGIAMDVPRLPSILLTPADCLDFLIGELFQGNQLDESWVKHQMGQRWSTGGWRDYTRRRLARLLRAKADRVDSYGGVTP